VNAALAVAAALVVAGSIRAIVRALPPRGGAASRRAAGDETSVNDLERLERVIATATMDAGDLHVRLRPILREIAADGLRRRGVDLEGQPDAARTLLAPGTWELVRPDRPRPDDPFARGLPPAQLDAVLDDLEALLT
jgi:hypothetical protein